MFWEQMFLTLITNVLEDGGWRVEDGRWKMVAGSGRLDGGGGVVMSEGGSGFFVIMSDT